MHDRVGSSGLWYHPDGRYDDQLTADDVTLAVLPMCHQYCWMSVASFLLVGHRVVVVPQFKPDEYVRLVDKYKVNYYGLELSFYLTLPA